MTQNQNDEENSTVMYARNTPAQRIATPLPIVAATIEPEVSDEEPELVQPVHMQQITPKTPTREPRVHNSLDEDDSLGVLRIRHGNAPIVERVEHQEAHTRAPQLVSIEQPQERDSQPPAPSTLTYAHTPIPIQPRQEAETSYPVDNNYSSETTSAPVPTNRQFTEEARDKPKPSIRDTFMSVLAQPIPHNTDPRTARSVQSARRLLGIDK
jgi:hypothetical protein